MNEDIKIIGGLKPTPPDERDFKLGALYNLPKLSELPANFLVGNPTIANQRSSDFCAAAATSTVSELQEGMPLSFEWLFAVAKMLEGNPDSFGVDLRTICKVHTKYGAIERRDAPFSVNDKSPDFLRRIENWPEELFAKALKHRKQSFVKVTGPYDHFDNIRATLWHFRTEKRGVVSGFLWSWSNSQEMMTQFANTGQGHAVAKLGWKTIAGVPYLIIQNSYGRSAGDEGRHYFSREVINHFVEMYGAYMFVDLSPNDIQNYYLDNGIKVGENWVIQLLKAFRLLALLKAMMKTLKAVGAKLSYGHPN